MLSPIPQRYTGLRVRTLLVAGDGCYCELCGEPTATFRIDLPDFKPWSGPYEQPQYWHRECAELASLEDVRGNPRKTGESLDTPLDKYVIRKRLAQLKEAEEVTKKKVNTATNFCPDCGVPLEGVECPDCGFRRPIKVVEKRDKPKVSVITAFLDSQHLEDAGRIAGKVMGWFKRRS